MPSGSVDSTLRSFYYRQSPVPCISVDLGALAEYPLKGSWGGNAPGRSGCYLRSTINLSSRCPCNINPSNSYSVLCFTAPKPRNNYKSISHYRNYPSAGITLKSFEFLTGSQDLNTPTPELIDLLPTFSAWLGTSSCPRAEIISLIHRRLASILLFLHTAEQ